MSSTYEAKCKEFRKSILNNDSICITKGYTLRLYPTKEQIQQINQELGNYRFIYNYTIGYLFDRYKEGKKIDYSGFDLINKLIPELKSQYDWIEKSSAQAVQHAVTEAREAFWKWLKNLKSTNAKRKASGKKFKSSPKFKKKHQDRQSYYISTQMYKPHLDAGYLTISKLGKVRFYYRGLPRLDRIEKCCDSRIIRKNGKYYFSITVILYKGLCEGYKSKPIGIDWGIHNLLTITDGKNIDQINSFLKLSKKDRRVVKNQESEISQLQDKITNLQLIIQRKVDVNKKRKLADPYHTRNIEKLWSKVRKYYDRISNLKQDYLNKTVYSLVKAKPRYIVIEDLKVSDNLMKTPDATSKDKRLRKLTLQTSPFMFRQKLISKCQEFSVELKLVPSNYPSTQLCSQCGTKVKIDLSNRKFKCPHCGLKIDRDENAAKNILNCKDTKCIVDMFGMLIG